MRKIVWPLAALALIAAIGFKIAADLPQKPTYLTLGRPTPTAVVSPADAAANGICRGTLTVEVFAPEMGITQDDVDAYAQRYKDEARSCDALQHVASVANADGSADEIYTMTIAGKNLWYIFSVDVDGKVSNIQ